MTDFKLIPETVVVPALAGFGAQYNQNVYAAISRNAGVTEANVAGMEQKVLSLKPHFVRIFFDHHVFADPDRMQSFARTVELAERSAASINITWQGGGTASPERSMSQFGDLLVDLVNNGGIRKLKWVTVLNEPNSETGSVTMEVYERLYRLLDANLTTAGVRGQIRLMGGDLLGTKSGLGQTQEDWFTFLATRMSDLLDAHSIHVYWDYWDTPKLERRLREVRAIYDRLPPSGRKPLYVTEYGVRGHGFPDERPGTYEDGTPLQDTNINAFQHAWFALLAAKLGYYGMVKWDAYFGQYDRKPQDFRMIGRPQDGWLPRPVYWLIRILTRTVRVGWKVVRVDGAAGTKLVTAFAGPHGRVTVIGLDTAGGILNGVSPTEGSYRLAGLPPNTSFQFLYWNRGGDGRNSRAASLVSDRRGILTVTAPLHSVFALTTLARP